MLRPHRRDLLEHGPEGNLSRAAGCGGEEALLGHGPARTAARFWSTLMPGTTSLLLP